MKSFYRLLPFLLFINVQCTQSTLLVKQQTPTKNYPVDILFTPELANLERFFLLKELPLGSISSISQIYRQSESEMEDEDRDKYQRSLWQSLTQNHYFSGMSLKSNESALAGGTSPYQIFIFYYGKDLKNRPLYETNGQGHLKGPTPFAFQLDSFLFAYHSPTKKLHFSTFITSTGSSGLTPARAKEDAMHKNIKSLLEILADKMPE